MLWSAIVCLGLLYSALNLVCYSLPWTWSAVDASHLTSSFAPFERSGWNVGLHPLICLHQHFWYFGTFGAFDTFGTFGTFGDFGNFGDLGDLGDISE